LLPSGLISPVGQKDFIFDSHIDPFQPSKLQINGLIATLVSSFFDHQDLCLSDHYLHSISSPSKSLQNAGLELIVNSDFVPAQNSNWDPVMVPAPNLIPF